MGRTLSVRERRFSPKRRRNRMRARTRPDVTGLGARPPSIASVSLQLFDSATRSVRPFEPLRPGAASIYVCGATVQAPPHIGHIRSGVNFDILRRWLTHTGYEVTFIRNVTDIDDKILAKSAAAGRPWWAWAAINETAFRVAYETLGCLRADLRAARDRARARDDRADAAADRQRARLRRRRRRLLRRGQLRRLRCAVAAALRSDAPGRRHRGRGAQARPARLRAVEGAQGRRAVDRVVGDSVGTGAAGLASRVLGDGDQVPRARRSTSTVAGSTWCSRTTRTKSPSRMPPATGSRGTGCTTPGSPSAARRCRSRWAIRCS